MHRGIEKYKDFVIFKVYYYILSILRIYNMEKEKEKTWMLKIENTSEYNKTTDWQVSKNLIDTERYLQ